MARGTKIAQIKLLRLFILEGDRQEYHHVSSRQTSTENRAYFHWLTPYKDPSPHVLSRHILVVVRHKVYA